MNKTALTERYIPVLPGCPTEQIELALVNLRKIPGVVKAMYDSQERRISIEYDLLINSYINFEKMLIEQGVFQRNSIRLKLLSIWYDYLDTTARDDFLAPPAPCCNKPPGRK